MRGKWKLLAAGCALLSAAGCTRATDSRLTSKTAPRAAPTDRANLAQGDAERPMLAFAPAKAAKKKPASYKSVLIEDVPHVRQKPDFCGEACAEMYLRKLGKSIDQDFVYNASGLDPLQGRGCYTADLARALEKIGFQIGPVWRKIAVTEAPAKLEESWKELHADLVAGVPSIVCMHYDDQPNTTEHFRLVLGYDADKEQVVYHEPAADRGAYRRMSKEQFLKLWPLGTNDEQWTVIRLRLKPGRLVDAKPAAGFTDADYVQHIMRLKPKLPGPEFTVVLQRPFVVIGDDSPEEVRKLAAGTVKWSVEQLKKTYFEKEPKHILDIWLFKDSTSYNTHAEELFGEKPTTPYGYFSSQHRALVMNISTGGGTLVHEIVHPFVATNFPDCPSWFNEGLASLYEMCGEERGKIHGYTNWRLAGLQRAIKGGHLTSFKDLSSTTTDEFYGDERGTNYGQARYLCYYLQEQGKLVDYYRRFVANHDEDPTGYETLQQVLGEKDMEAFQKKWEKYVMKLKF